jgi:hypothetical protein
MPCAVLAEVCFWRWVHTGGEGGGGRGACHAQC